MRKMKRYFPAILMVVGLVLGGCAWLLRPLEAKLTANPTSGPAPLDVEFKISFTGAVTSAVLYFGDGEYISNPSDSVVYRYNAQGQYIARLVVQDAQGRTATDSVTIRVLPGTTASLAAAPNPVEQGKGITFTLQATAAEGRTLVSWKFWFDYTTDADPDLQGTISGSSFFFIVEHEYDEAGSYTARLEVKDSENQTAVATLTITVTSPPPTIEEFKASGDGGTSWVSYEDDPALLSIDSGTNVEFKFKATPASGRKLTKWTLSTPGADIQSQTQTGLWDLLNVTGITRLYTNTTAQTKSYTATLQVWDDLNNSAQAAITIEVAPAAP